MSLTAKTILFVFLGAAFINLNAQEDYINFYQQSTSINNTGMYFLGSWAVINLATGTYGWLKADGTNKYFHQMNAMWNVVNLSIASFALINNAHFDIGSAGAEELWGKHLKTERLYLINGGLDLLYIGSGFLLKNQAKRNTHRSDLFTGYGNSLLLQGSFLLVFDLVMYIIQHSRSMAFTSEHALDLSLGFNSVSLSLSF